MREVYYCETSAGHEHLSSWEAENCSDLFERWQFAQDQLMASVREDEVTWQVDTILAEAGEAYEAEEARDDAGE